MLFLPPEDNAPYLAPYAYVIVLLGICFFVFRAFENWYSAQFDRPLFRHYWVYRKLTQEQITILEKEFDFYNQLNRKEKRQFRHRVARFLIDKKFIGRDGLEVTERMKVLIAAVGCMLSFGRKIMITGLSCIFWFTPVNFIARPMIRYIKGNLTPEVKL